MKTITLRDLTTPLQDGVNIKLLAGTMTVIATFETNFEKFELGIPTEHNNLLDLEIDEIYGESDTLVIVLDYQETQQELIDELIKENDDLKSKLKTITLVHGITKVNLTKEIELANSRFRDLEKKLEQQDEIKGENK